MHYIPHFTVLAALGALALGAQLISVSEPARASHVVAGEEEEAGSISGTFRSFARMKTRGATSERNVVVHLVPKGEQEIPAAGDERAVVRQAKLEFQPHVLAVQAGTTVRFENDDNVKHNVFSTEACCKVDADMNSGEHHDLEFKEEGLVPIVCRLHPDMSLWVVVVPTPWHASFEVEKVKGADKKSTYDGKFTIEGVPPGEYTLKVWNKKLEVADQDVTVSAGEATEVSVEVEK